MTDYTPRLIPAVLRHTADVLAGARCTHHFNAGGETWYQLGASTYDLITHPAAEAHRRRIGVPVLQNWDATQEEAAAELRATADTLSAPLGRLQADSALERMEEARRALAAAFTGYDGEDESRATAGTVPQLAEEVKRSMDDLRHRIGRLEAENERLRRENDRIRHAATADNA